jgi:predicted amidophosphoribosyltransferase
MSLMTCPDCTKEISTDARACPHCGRPKDLTIDEKIQQFGKGMGAVGKFLTALVTIPILIAIIVAMSGGCPAP